MTFSPHIFALANKFIETWRMGRRFGILRIMESNLGLKIFQLDIAIPIYNML